jgi:hypothetical protein
MASNPSPLPNIFAFGDVTRTGGVKMTRAGMYRAGTVEAVFVARRKSQTHISYESSHIRVHDGNNMGL